MDRTPCGQSGGRKTKEAGQKAYAFLTQKEEKAQEKEGRKKKTKQKMDKKKGEIGQSTLNKQVKQEK